MTPCVLCALAHTPYASAIVPKAYCLGIALSNIMVSKVKKSIECTCTYTGEEVRSSGVLAARRGTRYGRIRVDISLGGHRSHRHPVAPRTADRQHLQPYHQRPPGSRLIDRRHQPCQPQSPTQVGLCAFCPISGLRPADRILPSSSLSPQLWTGSVASPCYHSRAFREPGDRREGENPTHTASRKFGHRRTTTLKATPSSRSSTFRATTPAQSQCQSFSGSWVAIHLAEVACQCLRLLWYHIPIAFCDAIMYDVQ